MYDEKNTELIRQWLEQPAEDRDIPAGALLLLKLNKNRVLYNNILARPERLMPKLVYELKKFLLLRTDNMTAQAVVKMQEDIMPRVADIVEEPEQYTEGETHWGRRSDHDELPVEIQKLFEDSAERYKKIKSLYFSLKHMDHRPPCDRYEMLKLLAEAEENDRKAFEIYDSYSLENAEDPGSDGSDFTRKMREVNAARKFVSENREKLAAAQPDSKEAEELRAEMQRRVNFVMETGGTFALAHRKRLQSLGIVFNL